LKAQTIEKAGVKENLRLQTFQGWMDDVWQKMKDELLFQEKGK